MQKSNLFAGFMYNMNHYSKLALMSCLIGIIYMHIFQK